MQESQQKKVLDAFQLVLRPVVKILLRYGIGFSEFAEAVKQFMSTSEAQSSEFAGGRRIYPESR